MASASAAAQLQRLNNGEMVATFDLVPAPPERAPIVGEIRYLVPFDPSPSEPLASMVPRAPVVIVWTGKEWMMDG